MKYIVAVLFVLILGAGVTIFVYPDILSQLGLDSVSASFSSLLGGEEGDVEESISETDKATGSIMESELILQESGTVLLSGEIIEEIGNMDNVDLFSMFDDIPEYENGESIESDADSETETETEGTTPLVGLGSGMGINPLASDEEKELLSYVDKEPLYAREDEEIEEIKINESTNNASNDIANNPSSDEILVTLTLDTMTKNLTDPSGSIYDGEREYIGGEFFSYKDTIYHLSTDIKVPIAEKATFSVRDGAEASDRFFNYDGATIISKNNTSDLSAKEKYVREAMRARVMGE